MRYLLTGATGFVGANVLRQLIARGDEGVCVVRQPNLCTEGVAREVRIVDLLDVAGLAEAMAGCAGVFHVAGAFLPGPGGLAIMQRVHVHATEALLEAMAQARVPRMVYCSSSITVGYDPLAAPGDEDSPLDPEAVYGSRDRGEASGRRRAAERGHHVRRGVRHARTEDRGRRASPDSARESRLIPGRMTTI